MIQKFFLVFVICSILTPDKLCVYGGGAPGDTVVINSNSRYTSQMTTSSPNLQQQNIIKSSGGADGIERIGSGTLNQKSSTGSKQIYHQPSAGSGHIDHRNSYNLLSEAMTKAVSHEFSSLGSGSADGACHADDLDCYSGNIQDRLGMEAIKTLHRQLDDDDNGNIDLSESDDFLREELKYDSGYEKRQKAFHFNDDMHISVKELWEAWLRSEVHNWTIEQTTDWLAQSVQLPQYVNLFKLHKVTGAALPRLAVNNMHYVSNVLGIKDPIHKQKIALKAMDVVLFGPPRETGTRWKDYILVTLLLSAIIGCWYAYQQNKNAKRHLRRMAQDMEGLQRAEQSLQEMQKELERARMEQENVATEKLDLERRLKEAPSLSSSSSDLELQQLKQEIEMLRSELSRAEVELVDHCWSPPPQLQSWLQYTYELENKNHLKKRISAEKQLQCARDACEKLRKKRTSLVGAFVSTHGKSIDDVDRSIVEARNSLSEVTTELQERLHRWKQIESMLGFNIVNNNGMSFLENVLYNRNTGSIKNSRGRMTNSTDDLDDDSVQGMHDFSGRNSMLSNTSTSIGNVSGLRDDSSNSDDGDNQSVHFFLGGAPTPINMNRHSVLQTPESLQYNVVNSNHLSSSQLQNSHPQVINSNESSTHNNHDESRHSPSVSSERSIPVPPRAKKPTVHQSAAPLPPNVPAGRAPLPPPRKLNQSHIIRSQSTELQPNELSSYYYPLTHYQSTTSIGGQIASKTTTTGLITYPIEMHRGFNQQITHQQSTPTTPTSPTLSPTMSNVSGSLPSVCIKSNTSEIDCNTRIESQTNKHNQISVDGSNVIKTIMSPIGANLKTTVAHRDNQIDDTNSTDSFSLDDEPKSKKKKYRFTFGKKLTKSKLS